MAGMLSDIGNIREVNEDYYGYHEDFEKKLYIVADGMGGHNAGEVASKLAVDTIIEYINSICSLENLEKVLREAVEFTNKKIYELSRTSSTLYGMGTTLTACLINSGKMVIANVGDSRCYIVDRDGMYQITKDHSLVQELLDSGSITEKEAETHPNKNIITRALGTSPKVEVDTYQVNLQDIFKVMLCTDGLSNFLTLKEMYEIIIKNNHDIACHKLVELSKKRGGRDNITVIIFEGECKDGRDFTGQ
ncbi:Stp1/IreP family PP2C-type Ser/Thr phosphatase [Clostridium sp. SYSU_GA19001]|uniref:Stp1/IreP family PP2C-type Ser/Thr phosphatase n=1 Tax=Clostridium caldaquaticum TaxID=2940653 RepID=UPI0020772C9F|nr:Stp1/IreP family PP2C-type Ser/Thr phosphatase [Clostridium caldaquaticum]MCM8710573.1 Stp1/IreP family PP2C-type Ser/Thr phosphatase [Clostridium caldaquaticum]